MKMKLGKLPPKVHPMTLPFAKYLTGELPSPAAKVFREYKVPPQAMQMYGNDQYGDCTCAGGANLLILTSCHTGTVVVPTLKQVLDMYTAVTGFDQATGANDNGAAMTDVLEYLRTTGIAGHKILAWAKIDHTNPVHRRLAVDLFGGTYVGVNLPASAQNQFVDGKQCSWEVVPNSEIEGGHCIIRPGYGSEGGDYVSWANWFIKASTAWENMYLDEEYVIVTQDWINKATNKTPDGIDLSVLLADLKLLA
jgi:hypothetical protein